MENKYEILKDDFIQQVYNLDHEDDCWIYRKFYRIRALKDFGHVKKGELGGYVESYDNLDQKGECWVSDDARVIDKALVYGDALIMEQAIVMDNAVVTDSIIVRGDYVVDGSRLLEGNFIYGLKEDEDDKTDEGKKYEILEDDTIKHAYLVSDDGWFRYRTLYRIKALKDFNDVKKGDIGGYVEGYSNLSHEGKCWIYDDARVMNQASVIGNAVVRDNALIGDNAVVKHNAVVQGYARVMDNAVVCNDAIIMDNFTLMGDSVASGHDVFSCGYTYDGVHISGETKADGVKKSDDDDSEDDQAAERHNDGKLQWSLVDFECLEPLVRALEYGENKYSSFNWKKGMKQTKIIESLLRHTFAYLGGEDNDSESGVSHIGHIMSNAMFLANSAKSPEWDDRFKGLSNSKKTIKKVNPWYEEDI